MYLLSNLFTFTVSLTLPATGNNYYLSEYICMPFIHPIM